MPKLVNLSILRQVTADAMRVYEISRQLDGLEAETRTIAKAAEELLRQAMQAYLPENVEWTDTPVSRLAREAFINEYTQVQKAFSDLKSTLFKLAEAEVSKHPENTLKIAEVFLALDPDFPGVEGLWKAATNKIVDNCLTYSTTPKANTNVSNWNATVHDPNFGNLIKEQFSRLVLLLPWVSGIDGFTEIMSDVGRLGSERGARVDTFSINHMNFRTLAISKSIAAEWQKKTGKIQPEPTSQG